MAVHNPLDEGDFPKVIVNGGQKVKRATFSRILDRLSFFINAVFLLPVLGDISYSFDNEGDVTFILFIVTAFNTVIVLFFVFTSTISKPLSLSQTCEVFVRFL